MASGQKILSSLVTFSNSGQVGDCMIEAQVVEWNLGVPLRPLTFQSWAMPDSLSGNC